MILKAIFSLVLLSINSFLFGQLGEIQIRNDSKLFQLIEFYFESHESLIRNPRPVSIYFLKNFEEEDVNKKKIDKKVISICDTISVSDDSLLLIINVDPLLSKAYPEIPNFYSFYKKCLLSFYTGIEGQLDFPKRDFKIYQKKMMNAHPNFGSSEQTWLIVSSFNDTVKVYQHCILQYPYYPRDIYSE